MGKIIKKRKLKKHFIFVIFGFFAFFCAIKLFSYFTSIEYKLKKVGYNYQEIKIIQDKLDDDSAKNLLNNSYNKNLINLLQDKNFSLSKIKDYLYYYNDNYKKEYDPRIVEIINDQYYKRINLNRYMQYYEKNNDLSSREIVENVNCNLDSLYYSKDYDADVSKGDLVLVNKYYKLSSDYVPSNLVKIDKKYGYERLIDENAYKAFIDMYNAATNEGLEIFITSPYRSYKYQETLYNNYVADSGKEKAETFAARAGYSEHQTGLSVDLAAKDSIYTKFEKTKEYKWMLSNSYKYGFILRYPKGKEKQTGYMFEAWHFRFVGKDVAKYIFENSITYDEYYEYFIK